MAYPNDHVDLLQQMGKDGEVVFSVIDSTIDEVSDNAFFGNGTQGVELIEGPKG